jgi:hypothetical protein
MAKSKKKKSGKSAARALLVRALLWTGVLALLATALWLGGETVWSRVAAHERFAVHPARDFVVVDMPRWVQRRAMRAELARVIAPETPEAASIFYPAGPASDQNTPAPADASLAKLTARALQQCPWLARVDRVSVQLPDRVRLQVQFRKPAGIVSCLGKRYLVDRNGQYLGREGRFFNMPAEHGGNGAPIIVEKKLGIRSSEVMELDPFDPRWPAHRLAVGARLHLFLLNSGIYSEVNISRINVTWVDRDAGNTYVGGLPQAAVTLKTAEGLDIRWGKTSAYDHIPGISEPPARDSDTHKLRRLRTIMDKYPAFPYLDGPVDLRWNRTRPGQSAN